MKCLGFLKRQTGKKHKGKYLEAKSQAWKVVYQARWEARRKRFADITQRDNQKCGVFNIWNGILKTHQDFIG